MWPVLTIRESFLREMLLSYRSVKVLSLENFPLYGIFAEIGDMMLAAETFVSFNTSRVRLSGWRGNPQVLKVV